MKNIAWCSAIGALILFPLAFLTVACGGLLTSGPPIGGDPGSPSPTPGPGTGSGSVALFVRDAPMEELVEFEIIVTDVIFDPGTVSVLSFSFRTNPSTSPACW